MYSIVGNVQLYRYRNQSVKYVNLQLPVVTGLQVKLGLLYEGKIRSRYIFLNNNYEYQ